MTDSKRQKKATQPGDTTLSFEQSLALLEKTIDQLEQEDLTLDSSLTLFEQGVSLIRTCDTHLKKAQGTISELLAGENGAYVEKLLGSSLDAFMAKEGTHE